MFLKKRDREALYIALRRFRRKVTSKMMVMEVPLPKRSAATNWDEPANTKKDMAKVANGDKPFDMARAPKTIPNVATPISKGKTAR